jgi:hypothetical protein
MIDLPAIYAVRQLPDGRWEILALDSDPRRPAWRRWTIRNPLTDRADLPVAHKLVRAPRMPTSLMTRPAGLTPQPKAHPCPHRGICDGAAARARSIPPCIDRLFSDAFFRAFVSAVRKPDIHGQYSTLVRLAALWRPSTWRPADIRCPAIGLVESMKLHLFQDDKLIT